ncbi:MAG: ABC transporter substrate-binding protein [Pseudomonadota bacterium]
MQRASRRSVLATTLLFGGLLVTTSAAALEQGAARAFIADLADETTTVLTSNLPQSERRERITALLEEGFDLPFIARLVLGPTYRSLTPEQQQAYTAAFERFVLATYGRRFDDYSGQRLIVVDAAPEGQQDVRVRSRVEGGGQPTLGIDWRVRDRGGELRIIDVAVEGVSMTITQRNEFNAVVQREGIDGLIAMLQDRTAAAS